MSRSQSGKNGVPGIERPQAADPSSSLTETGQGQADWIEGAEMPSERT